MTVRRDPLLAALVGVVYLGAMPAWDLVFEDTAWRAPALLAAVSALLVAGILRRLRVGTFLTLGASGLVLLSLMPWLVGASTRPMLPTPTTWDVVLLHLQQAAIDIDSTRAPAPSLPGLVAVIVLGSWLVVHASHELVVRWRRPALAAVPLTAWWVTALAIPSPTGRGWPQMVAFMTAVLLALLVISNDDRAPDEITVRVPAAGVVAGAVAIAVAAAGPGLLPGYASEPWTELGGGGGGNPRGYQPIVDISERLQLPAERDVLRVQASQRLYLRMAGLDSFDGATWRVGPLGEGSYRPDSSSLFAANGVLPPEQPAGRTEAVFADVEVLDLQNIYVPVPYQPVEVLGDSRDEMVWSTEGGFLATWDTTEADFAGDKRVGVTPGVTYSVQAARPTPTREDLLDVTYDAVTLAQWTQLPRDYPALRAEAEAVYEAAGAVEVVDRVLALQEWFAGDSSEFVYDLDVPALRGEDALERFVLEDKVGYCEYYATAMAVMLRETGIPARVAVGFLPGRVSQEATADRELTEFIVSTSDAHAWVEVLFPGAGWITFEPTPRSDESQIVPTALDLAPIENQAERRERERDDEDGSGSDEVSGLPIPDTDTDLFPENQDGAMGAPVPNGAEGTSGAVWYVAGLLLVVAILLSRLLLRLRRQWRWRHDGTPEGRILAAQRRLFDVAARYGVGRRPEETSIEVVDRWHDERRIDRRGRTVAHAAQAAAFGGSVDDSVALQTELLVREFEAMLRDSVEPRERMLMPVRTRVGAVRSGGRRLAQRLRDH